jgi:endonuclease YncB( thermonuclease family)
MACRLKAVEAVILVLALALVSTTPTLAANALTGIPTVIDGDTIDIHGQRIRFHGIDAPESKQICVFGGIKYRCGQKAALALSDRIWQRVCDLRSERYRPL